MDSVSRWILLGSWVLFISVWTVMAFTAKRDVYKQSQNERESYTVAFVASLVFMVLPMKGHLRPEDARAGMYLSPLLSEMPAFQWGSAVCALCGVTLALWARMSLGRNWSGMVALKDEHELVTKGPYRFVRHPIYTALVLMVLATTLAYRASFSVLSLLLMIWSCWIKLRAEEEVMIEAFPDRYPEYMERTKRLIPFLV